MRKEIITLIVLILLVVGCKNKIDTPVDKVENFIGKYQRLDSDVLSQLDMIVANRSDLNDKQKEKYRSLMERQYQNLSYKIVDEIYDEKEEHANVIVNVLVYDYGSAIEKSDEYLKNNKKEFIKEDNSIDIEKYWDYKISEMIKVEDRVNNEIIFTLHKKNNKWVLENISDIDREKIHGIYKS